MTPALRRLIVVLGAITALMLIILVQQLRTAKSMITKPVDLPLVSPTAVDIPITKDDEMTGNPGAPLTVVGFFDITNTESRQYFSEIYQLVIKNPTKIRLVWKFFPEKAFFHDPMMPNQALYCAGLQGKFWAMAEKLAAEKRTLKESRIKEISKELKLNQTLLDSCVSSEESAKKIDADYALGQSLYLPDPPRIFANNKLLNLDQDIDLTELITSLL